MELARRLYWCFISYRHVDNKDVGREWATWLHQQLETYEVPEDLVGVTNERGDLIPMRIFPVFRDEEEIEPGDLNEKIYRALESSKVLIVICSPRALESKYVYKEISYFKRLGKADRVYAAVIDGDPAAAGPAGCFPEPLCYAVDEEGNLVRERRVEPMAADFRLADGSQGWASVEAYRESLTDADDLPKEEVARRVESYRNRLDASKLKLIAAVLGVPFGTLQKRDKAYQLALARRRARTLRRWLAAVSVLTLLAVAAAWFANEQRKIAVQRARIATSRELALVASNSVREQPDLAFLLATESYRSFDTYEARYALFTAITNRPHLRLIAHAERGEVTSLSRSRDGAVVAAVYKDGSVLFWSPEKFEPHGPPLPAHAGPVVGAQFSPAADVLVTASGEEVRFWDAARREPLADPMRTDLGEVSALTFSGDGKYLASAHARGVAVWEVASPQRVIRRIEEAGGASCIALSADGALLAAGDYGGYVRVWNVADGRPVGAPFPPTQRFIHSVAFSPDGVLAVGGSSPNVTLWDVRKRRQVREPLRTDGGRTSVLFDAATGQIAASEISGTINVWPELSSLTPLNPHVLRLGGHRGAVNALIFGRGGEYLISGGADGKLIKWGVADASPLSRPLLRGASSFATAGRANLLAVGGSDGKVSLWEPDTRSPLPFTAQAGEQAVLGLALDGEGARLAAVYADKLTVWGVSQNRLLTTVPLSPENNVNRLAFTPAGRLVIAAAEPWSEEAQKSRLVVSTLDPETGQAFGEPLHIALSHQNTPASLSDDGELVAVAEDAAVGLWRVRDRRPAGGPFNVGSKATVLRFSRDGSRMAVGTSNGRVVILETGTGKILGELQSNPNEDMHALAFSPDGRLLVTGGNERVLSGASEGRLRLWDLATHQQIGQLSAEWSPLTFSASGRTLLTLDEGAVLAWDVSVESWYQTALRMANRPLNENERRRFSAAPLSD